MKKTLTIISFLLLTNNCFAAEVFEGKGDPQNPVIIPVETCPMAEYLIPTKYSKVGKSNIVSEKKCINVDNHVALKAEIVKEFDRKGDYDFDINYWKFLGSTVQKEWADRGLKDIDLKRILLAAEIVPSFKTKMRKYIINLLR